MWRARRVWARSSSSVCRWDAGCHITGFHHLHENPTENLVNSLRSKPVTEVITDSREMGRVFLQTIAKEPAVCHIERHFFCCAAQRPQTIQVLNENHLEQDNRIHTGTAIVCTVQWLYHIVDLAKIYRFVDFTQQMSLGHQTFSVHNFKNSPFHFSTFQHLSSPETIIP